MTIISAKNLDFSLDDFIEKTKKEKVYDHFNYRIEQYKQLSIFSYINQVSNDQIAKMRPVALFMFPMLIGFADFQKFLKEKAGSEESYDSIQKYFISHANEELDHYTFLWHDLNVLGLNAKMNFTDFIKVYMADDLTISRQFWLNFIDLFSELNSLEKRASMEASEKMAFYFLSSTVEKIKDNNLEYFGKKHLDAEIAHEEINGANEIDFLDVVNINSSDYHSLIYAIDKTFNYFFEWMNEMHNFCKQNPNLTEKLNAQVCSA